MKLAPVVVIMLVVYSAAMGYLLGKRVADRYYENHPHDASFIFGIPTDQMSCEEYEYSADVIRGGQAKLVERGKGNLGTKVCTVWWWKP